MEKKKREFHICFINMNSNADSYFYINEFHFHLTLIRHSVSLALIRMVNALIRVGVKWARQRQSSRRNESESEREKAGDLFAYFTAFGKLYNFISVCVEHVWGKWWEEKKTKNQLLWGQNPIVHRRDCHNIMRARDTKTV